MDKIKIIITQDFSYTPGPRSKEEGDFSAELILEKLIIPRFEEALEKGVELVIDLDGTAGYATSFLEGVFGELVRLYDKKIVKESIKLISEEEPYLLEEINLYLDNAES